MKKIRNILLIFLLTFIFFSFSSYSKCQTIEGEETLEEGTKREIKEEFGIDVEVVKKLYEMDNGEQNKKEYFFLCKYISGEFGTGTGPEFSGNPKYAHRGKYIPEIIAREDVEKITLLPPEIKEKFVKDIKNM